MRATSLTHEFVELMPPTLEQGTLYISIPYQTAIHLCACGCGIRVVTPISPPEWQLTWDGDTVSLYPSIGNWQFPCRSHYWIRRSRIVWAADMSDQEIAALRTRDRQQLEAYFGAAPATQAIEALFSPKTQREPGSLQRLLRLLRLRRR